MYSSAFCSASSLTALDSTVPLTSRLIGGHVPELRLIALAGRVS